MSYFQALLFGLVQGITEYLPVSSSAHLILLPRFLGIEDPGLTFDVFLHVGTLAATLAYFWREWLGVARTLPVIGRRIAEATAQAEGPRDPDLDWKLVAIATVPALAAGALLHGWVATSFRGNAVLMVTLPLGGLLLVGADRLFRSDRELDRATVADAVIVGLFQCLALVPGMSRSGSTILGARAAGFDRASAARFSFLISAPVTAAAIVFELRHWRELWESPIGAGPLLVAGFSSAVFGMVAIGGLLRLLRSFGFASFAVYRVGLALVIYSALGV